MPGSGTERGAEEPVGKALDDVTRTEEKDEPPHVAIGRFEDARPNNGCKDERGEDADCGVGAPGRLGRDDEADAEDSEPVEPKKARKKGEGASSRFEDFAKEVKSKEGGS